MVYGLWLWFMVYGLWFMVYGLWCRVRGLGVGGVPGRCSSRKRPLWSEKEPLFKKRLLLEILDQILALTVLCVPHSFESGPDCLVCAMFVRQRPSTVSQAVHLKIPGTKPRMSAP